MFSASEETILPKRHEALDILMHEICIPTWRSLPLKTTSEVLYAEGHASIGRLKRRSTGDPTLLVLTGSNFHLVEAQKKLRRLDQPLCASLLRLARRKSAGPGYPGLRSEPRLYGIVHTTLYPAAPDYCSPDWSTPSNKIQAAMGT